MKGYKKFLKIICQTRVNKKKYYCGYCKIGFAKYVLQCYEVYIDQYSGEMKRNFQLNEYGISFSFESFEQCKCELRKQFLKLIMDMKDKRGSKIIKTSKVWP